MSSLDVTLEKFIWDVSSLPHIPPGDLDSPYAPPPPILPYYPPDVDDRIVNTVIQRQMLEDSLRAAMIRTAYSDSNLSPLPEDCTFTLTIELRPDFKRPGKVPPGTDVSLLPRDIVPCCGRC
jgi:mitotic spindle assembly checkpoint protein MAD2B